MNEALPLLHKQCSLLKDTLRAAEQALADRAARIAELEEALRWYVRNDDTNATEYNEPWLEGKRRAMALLGMEADEC